MRYNINTQILLPINRQLLTDRRMMNNVQGHKNQSISTGRLVLNPSVHTPHLFD